MNLIFMSGEWTKQFETLSERLFLGTAMALVGFIIVFLLLIAIIIAISVMSGAISLFGIDNNSKKVKETKEVKVIKESKVEKEKDVLISEDSSLVAIITAAIAAFTSSNNTKPLHPGFIVKKIRRL